MAVQSIGTCHRSAILSKARREVKKKITKINPNDEPRGKPEILPGGV